MISALLLCQNQGIFAFRLWVCGPKWLEGIFCLLKSVAWVSQLHSFIFELTHSIKSCLIVWLRTRLVRLEWVLKGSHQEFLSFQGLSLLFFSYPWNPFSILLIDKWRSLSESLKWVKWTQLLKENAWDLSTRDLSTEMLTFIRGTQASILQKCCQSTQIAITRATKRAFLLERKMWKKGPFKKYLRLSQEGRVLRLK